jgi:hypothetical protein
MFDAGRDGTADPTGAGFVAQRVKNRGVASQTVTAAPQPSQILVDEVVKQAIERILADGERVTVRRVYDRVRGQVSQRAVEGLLRQWRAAKKG